MKDDGGPAFPLQDWDECIHSRRSETGMTLRDWFAGMALPSLLNHLGDLDKKALESVVESSDVSWLELVNNTDSDNLIFNYEAAAFKSYRIADAMLSARKENQ